jgi:S1-C subfamily serine protease
MKKITAIFIMLFMVVACTPRTEVVYDNVKDGVVFIQNKHNEQSGLGTGFFIEENLIITNYHVVKDSKNINIFIQDSNYEWKATVVSHSEQHDIALVKIDDWDKFVSKEKWKVLEFTDSTQAQVGETVYALGHPWGLGWTFSQGILSKKDRQASTSTAVLFLQVDARIYQGNSGGPLLDAYGRVLGINSQMLEGKGGSYGFVIPSQYVQKVVYDLKRYNESKVMKLGIMLGLTNDKEYVTITEIMSDSAAEKCNLQKDDIVLEMKTLASGTYQKVKNTMDMVKQVLTLNMDQGLVSLIIKRSETRQEVDCEIGSNADKG